MRLHALVLAGLAIALSVGSVAQIQTTPISKPVPVSDPDQLLKQLMLGTARDENCKTDAREKAQTAALAALGIPATNAYDVNARVVYEDIDGDGIAEALFTVEIDLSDVVLVVLKRKGDQWYRLPSPPGFSCWCKYEKFPLDSFVELQGWRGPGNELTRLIFVRASGGGTGLYERSLTAYSLKGFEIKPIFNVVDERRECDWLDGHCESSHVIVEWGIGSPASLITREIRFKGDGSRLGSDESWWTGLPVASCQAYAWSASDFKFSPSAEATAKSCQDGNAGAEVSK